MWDPVEVLHPEIGLFLNTDMKNFFKVLRRLFWALLVGFMIAWHNVYQEEVMLQNQTNIKQEVQEEDQDRKGADE